MTRLRMGALIAAAGKSERMGFDKALLPIFGQSLLAFSAHTISQIKPIFFCATLPPRVLFDQRFVDEVFLLNLKLVANRYPENGYGGSIKTVLKDSAFFALEGMLISPVDVPLADVSLLIAIANLAEFFRKKPIIIVPYFCGFPGHPVYISKHFFEAFVDDKITSLRTLLAENKQHIKALLWHNKAVLINLNYAQQFENFIMDLSK